MFYKLMNNDIVVDLFREICYMRYLPNSKRWVNTDPQSANAVMAAGGDIIYRLSGKAIAYPNELTSVRVVEITEEEYTALIASFSKQKQENTALRNEINSLKAQLDEQNSLLQQILAKL